MSFRNRIFFQECCCSFKITHSKFFYHFFNNKSIFLAVKKLCNFILFFLN
ncbi:hypothetical protein vBEcoMWL3_gp242 [Escherichia phage vB_EcoM_WL-3]|nr:hypothetical protein vBEcoMWL3_gp242 [Escherichia phage vB_EcoM_WL-3]